VACGKPFTWREGHGKGRPARCRRASCPPDAEAPGWDGEARLGGPIPRRNDELRLGAPSPRQDLGPTAAAFRRGCCWPGRDGTPSQRSPSAGAGCVSSAGPPAAWRGRPASRRKRSVRSPLIRPCTPAMPRKRGAPWAREKGRAGRAEEKKDRGGYGRGRLQVALGIATRPSASLACPPPPAIMTPRTRVCDPI